MLGFSSRANWRNCCTARCWSIWYRLFIATLSFSWQKKPPSAHYDRGCESRYFLRINGHPHQSRIIKGLPWTLLTLVVGWWGIPWGPIRTVQSLWINLSGGTDVTAGIADALQLTGVNWDTVGAH